MSILGRQLVSWSESEFNDQRNSSKPNLLETLYSGSVYCAWRMVFTRDFCQELPDLAEGIKKFEIA